MLIPFIAQTLRGNLGSCILRPSNSLGATRSAHLATEQSQRSNRLVILGMLLPSLSRVLILQSNHHLRVRMGWIQHPQACRQSKIRRHSSQVCFVPLHGRRRSMIAKASPQSFIVLQYDAAIGRNSRWYPRVSMCNRIGKLH